MGTVPCVLNRKLQSSCLVQRLPELARCSLTLPLECRRWSPSFEPGRATTCPGGKHRGKQPVSEAGEPGSVDDGLLLCLTRYSHSHDRRQAGSASPDRENRWC